MHLRVNLRAVSWAVLVGYGAPFLVIAFPIASLSGWAASRGINGGPAIFVLWVLLATVGPVVTGFVAARVAKSRPLLHGLLAGCLCALLAIGLTGFDGIVGGIVMYLTGMPLVEVLSISASMTWLLFIAGGLGGAWLWRRRAVNATAL